MSNANNDVLALAIEVLKYYKHQEEIGMKEPISCTQIQIKRCVSFPLATQILSAIEDMGFVSENDSKKYVSVSDEELETLIAVQTTKSAD